MQALIIESPKRGLKRTPHQQGQALIFALLVLGAAASAILFSYYNSTALTVENDQKTTDALARAKAALIGYALRGSDGATNPQRPGEFPCPDTDNDGFDDGTCVAGRLGRIPWKTLGIPEPKDGAGETLWYTVADLFRSYNSGSLNNHPINSDTRGTIADPSLTVYAADGTTTLTTQAVAVIFAPGPALGAQGRSPTTSALCPTTGTNIAQNLCAANYLETSTGINNATTNGPFINGQRSPTYNDRVLFITTPEFIPAVEMRVASELKTILQAYDKANGYFPFAAAYDNTSGNCALNVRRGRVPLNISTTCSGLAELSGSLPNWFKVNNWWQVMYYSVAPGYAYGGPNSCAGGCLTVGANASVPALFFTPGTPRNAAWRVPGVLDTDLTHYLEDAQNQDGWGGGANDIYVTPTATAPDRDRIIIPVGGAPSPPQCANNAAQLVSLAPCGQPPHLNPQCATLAANLAVCTCATVASQIINPPCQNTLNPPACQAAVATLKACNS